MSLAVEMLAELPLLHRDDDFLVIHKPPFLLSVPGRLPENKDSVISRIQSVYPEAGMAHRLDMDTSGIMVVPTHARSLSHINKQFRDRRVHKEYIAVLDGLLEQDSGAVELPLACDWPNRPRQQVNFHWGKSSLTLYDVLDRDELACTTRVRLFPVTGRSHQLRVHMQAIGHAIVGCPLYASPEARSRSPRLLLHAEQLSFLRPSDGERVSFHCPAPF